MDSIWIGAIDYPLCKKEKYMDIIVRDINKKFINEIDKRCKELKEQTGKHWSRNDYLKLLIENDFDRPLMEYKRDQFDQLLEKFTNVQTHNTKILEEYTDVVNQLIQAFIAEEK